MSFVELCGSGAFVTKYNIFLSTRSESRLRSLWDSPFQVALPGKFSSGGSCRFPPSSKPYPCHMFFVAYTLFNWKPLDLFYCFPSFQHQNALTRICPRFRGGEYSQCWYNSLSLSLISLSLFSSWGSLALSTQIHIHMHTKDLDRHVSVYQSGPHWFFQVAIKTLQFTQMQTHSRTHTTLAASHARQSDTRTQAERPRCNCLHLMISQHPIDCNPSSATVPKKMIERALLTSLMNVSISMSPDLV